MRTEWNPFNILDMIGGQYEQYPQDQYQQQGYQQQGYQQQGYQQPYSNDGYQEESSGMFSSISLKTKLMICLCIMVCCICVCSAAKLRDKCKDDGTIIGYIHNNTWTWIPTIVVGICFPPLIVGRIAIWGVCTMMP
jgi:hypothetical protein